MAVGTGMAALTGSTAGGAAELVVAGTGGIGAAVSVAGAGAGDGAVYGLCTAYGAYSDGKAGYVLPPLPGATATLAEVATAGLSVLPWFTSAVESSACGMCTTGVGAAAGAG